MQSESTNGQNCSRRYNHVAEIAEKNCTISHGRILRAHLLGGTPSFLQQHSVGGGGGVLQFCLLGATDGVHRSDVEVLHKRQAGRGDGGQGRSERVPRDEQLAALAPLVEEVLDDRDHAFRVPGAGEPHSVDPVVETLLETGKS